jgi:hypothetical protein
MEHVVALVELQDKVLDLLGATERGFAEIETVGGSAPKASLITPVFAIWINARNRNKKTITHLTILLCIAASFRKVRTI